MARKNKSKNKTNSNEHHRLDDAARAAWLYYVAENNQGETLRRWEFPVNQHNGWLPWRHVSGLYNLGWITQLPGAWN